MDYNTSCLALVVLILTIVQGRVIQRKEEQMQAESMQYLKKYGYMRGSDDPERIKSALRLFQSMAKIPQTGAADAATMQMMRTKRCGVPDFMTEAEMHDRRRKRFALRGSQWENTTLSYKINKWTRDLSNAAQREIFANAFMTWSNVTPLQFTYHRFFRAKINIAFEKGNHGDGISNKFDGPGGTLAHAYFPDTNRKGEIHFDEDEQWATNNRQGTDLLQTAVHEIGHTLGLLHSGVKGSIMYPFYDSNLTNVRLHSDDIAGIQAIYGPPPMMMGNGD